MTQVLHRYQLITGLILLFLLAFVSTAMTQTMYVTDAFQITFRSGKGKNFKILQLLSSETRVKIIKQEDDWSQVELDNGQTGWVLTRYLMKGPPKSIIIERLNRELEDQKSQIGILVEENASLKKSNEELLKQANSFKKDWENTRRNYEELLAGSSEYLEIKSKYENLKADMQLLTGRLHSLQRENEKLQARTRLYWFLSGSLVLLVGLMVGISLGRFQRRKKTLYP